MDDAHPRGLNARLGHWPLLWLLIPMLLGYVLGASVPFSLNPLWLIGPGLLCACLSIASLQVKSTWKPGLWGCLFIASILQLSWAYWLIREPNPPSGWQMPPREVRVQVSIERVFASVRQAGPVSGLSRVVEPPRLLPGLAGQRVYFQAWPEGYREELAPGAVVSLRGRLATLEDADDDYGFEAFLIRSGVYYELDPGSVQSLDKPAPALQQWARKRNSQIRDTLRLGADTEASKILAGVSEAMLLGRKQALGSEQKERFIESGTMHLFAVSGLHVGIVAAAIYFVFNSLRVPRRVGAIVGLLCVWAYVQIVGEPPSAVRAFLMILVYWLALAFTRKPSSMSALLGSAIMVLLWNPQELLRPGFQLSYAVVGGILMYGLPLADYLTERLKPYRYLPEQSWPWHQRVRAWLWRAILISLSVSIAATLFSAPLSIAIFAVFTPGAILLNTLLLPLASASLITAGFSAVLGMMQLGILSLWVNHLSWGLNWLLDKIVAAGLWVPGLFHEAQWRDLALAPVTLCLMFLGYLIVLHLRARTWHFCVPPGILAIMLVLGVRLV